MKKSYFFALIALVFIATGCGKGSANGELIGVDNKKFKNNIIPSGMVYIPAGTFLMGQTDQDITFAQIAQNKQVTVQAFYMDETEITNAEYRQFVNWVRDSVAITRFISQKDKFYMKTKGAQAGANQKKFIDWKKVGNGSIIWSNKKDQAVAKDVEAMYYTDMIYDRKEINKELLEYDFSWMDFRAALANRNDPQKSRAAAIRKEKVKIYPDTLVWLADFAYAQNEPMVEGYFSHPAFDNYPVVGVTWQQARAFSVWRTRLYEGYAVSRKMPRLSRLPYELPTEAQFEYAARGGRIGNDYPWGGPYIKNAKGCLMANFKPGRGNYIDDGGTFTVNVKSYFPNDFGLYNMAGNVAEWTSSTFDESASTFTHDLNPTYQNEASNTDPEVLKRKVIRGGSWKDIGYFLQNSTRTFEYQDQPKSYIGFRCVTPFPGRDIKDKR